MAEYEDSWDLLRDPAEIDVRRPRGLPALLDPSRSAGGFDLGSHIVSQMSQADLYSPSVNEDRGLIGTREGELRFAEHQLEHFALTHHGLNPVLAQHLE